MKDYVLVSRFPELAEALLELKEEIKQVSRPPEEKILDDVELREMLKVSKRTTATWRQKGLIKHYRLEGKCFYILSDVLDALKQNTVNPIKTQLKIKL